MQSLQRLENKYEMRDKIYITRSSHTCLDFVAAVVYLSRWFILHIFIDFFTFYFNIKPEKNKIFFHKLNSFQLCLGCCKTIYEMLHLNAETNGLTCPILDNHVAEDVSKKVSLFWEEDSVIK